MLNKLPEKKLNYLILIAGVIFILFTILMMSSNKIINAAAHNIIDIEFMWTYDQYQLVMANLSQMEIDAVIINTWLDFGWIVGYCGLIILVFHKNSRKLTGTIRKLVSIASNLGIVAAIMDILENIGLLNLFYQSSLVFKGLPFMVSMFAGIKFICVLYWIIIFAIFGKFIVQQTINKRRNA